MAGFLRLPAEGHQGSLLSQTWGRASWPAGGARARTWDSGLRPPSAHSKYTTFYIYKKIVLTLYLSVNGCHIVPLSTELCTLTHKFSENPHLPVVSMVKQLNSEPTPDSERGMEALFLDRKKQFCSKIQIPH